MKKMGRWVLIAKNYPGYVIAAHEAYMPHCWVPNQNNF
jgi:hypothetical protein